MMDVLFGLAIYHAITLLGISYKVSLLGNLFSGEQLSVDLLLNAMSAMSFCSLSI